MFLKYDDWWVIAFCYWHQYVSLCSVYSLFILTCAFQNQRCNMTQWRLLSLAALAVLMRTRLYQMMGEKLGSSSSRTQTPPSGCQAGTRKAQHLYHTPTRYVLPRLSKLCRFSGSITHVCIAEWTALGLHTLQNYFSPTRLRAQPRSINSNSTFSLILRSIHSVTNILNSLFPIHLPMAEVGATILGFITIIFELSRPFSRSIARLKMHPKKSSSFIHV
jgi:hypothetical protein